MAKPAQIAKNIAHLVEENYPKNTDFAKGMYHSICAMGDHALDFLTLNPILAATKSDFRKRHEDAVPNTYSGQIGALAPAAGALFAAGIAAYSLYSHLQNIQGF